MGGLFVAVDVVGQAVEWHQTLGRNGQALYEQAEGLDARDHGFHLLADPLREEEQELELHQLALGRLGSPLEVGALAAELHETGTRTLEEFFGLPPAPDYAG